MHHPPIESGIEWMNTHPDEPWVHRFTDVVRGHDQVRGLICGHLHRAVTVAWVGRTIAICSSTAPQVRSEEHTSELQSLLRISYAVFCLKKQNHINTTKLAIDLPLPEKYITGC